MNPEEFVRSDGNLEEVSSDAGDDKIFVSQAVAFVISHARNGFVSLCASVANLLKNQAKLKEDIEKLQNEIAELKLESTKKRCKEEAKDCKNRLKTSGLNKSQSSKFISFKRSKDSDTKSLDILKPQRMPYRTLKGCICKKCSKMQNECMLECPLKKGTRVVIVGELCGIVCYVGHVDELTFPEIYVGLQLSEAVGNTDGKLENKVYFVADKNCGLFTSLKNVCCILN